MQEFKDKIERYYDTISLDLPIALRAGQIVADLKLAGREIGFADSAIAATALERNLVLVTSNVTHFQRVADTGYTLRIESWRP